MVLVIPNFIFKFAVFFFFVGESEKERYDEVKVVLNWPINGLPVRWVNHIHGFLLWVL